MAVLRAHPADTHQPVGEHLDGDLAVLRQVGELRLDQHADVFEHVVLVRQRDVKLRRVRVLDDQLVQVVQPLGQQHRGDVGLLDGRVVRPAQDLDDVGGELPAELDRLALRDDELGKVDDHRDPPRHLRPLPDGLHVQRAEQVPVDQLRRPARLANDRQAGRLRPGQALQPLGIVVRPLRRADAAAAVVLQHHVVVGEHHLVQERLERQQPVAVAGVRRDHIENVAVNDELRDRARAEQVAHLLRPGGQTCGFGLDHCFWSSMAGGITAGGDSSRSSTCP